MESAAKVIHMPSSKMNRSPHQVRLKKHSGPARVHAKRSGMTVPPMGLWMNPPDSDRAEEEKNKKTGKAK